MSSTGSPSATATISPTTATAASTSTSSTRVLVQNACPTGFPPRRAPSVSPCGCTRLAQPPWTAPGTHRRSGRTHESSGIPRRASETWLHVPAILGDFEAEPADGDDQPVGEQPVDQYRGGGGAYRHAESGQPGDQRRLQGAQATGYRGGAGHDVAAQIDGPDLDEGQCAAEGVHAEPERHDLHDGRAKGSYPDERQVAGAFGYLGDGGSGGADERPDLVVVKTAAPGGEAVQSASDQSHRDEHQHPLVDVEGEVHGGVPPGPGEEHGEEQQVGGYTYDGLQTNRSARGAAVHARRLLVAEAERHAPDVVGGDSIEERPSERHHIGGREGQLGGDGPELEHGREGLGHEQGRQGGQYPQPVGVLEGADSR